MSRVLDMGTGGEVDEEGEEGAEQRYKTGEGEIPPGVASGDGAVGEGVEGVWENMDEGGGEDDAGGEALDEEDSAVVGGLAVEEAGKEDRGGNADDASEEDDEDGDELEVGRRSTVSAGGFSSRVGHASTHLQPDDNLNLLSVSSLNFRGLRCSSFWWSSSSSSLFSGPVRPP